MSAPKNDHNVNNIINPTSWNARALNKPSERAKVFAHLRDLHADILFLQETHIKHMEAVKM